MPGRWSQAALSHPAELARHPLARVSTVVQGSLQAAALPRVLCHHPKEKGISLVGSAPPGFLWCLAGSSRQGRWHRHPRPSPPCMGGGCAADPGGQSRGKRVRDTPISIWRWAEPGFSLSRSPRHGESPAQPSPSSAAPAQAPHPLRRRKGRAVPAFLFRTMF